MKKLLAVLLLSGSAVFAQTTINATNINTKNVTALAGGGAGVDLRNANHTLPYKVGTVAGLPVSCSSGERYFASDAPQVGQQSYTCLAGVWTKDFSAGVTVSSGTVDFSGAAHTLTSHKGLTGAIPVTCTVGEEYFATDATAGRNKFYCTAPNVWTQQVSGGVTSVAMTVPAIMAVSGSPITTTGTFGVTLNNQNQNIFLAGPGSGAAATPTFRAIVPLDLGTGSATSSNFLRGDQTWATPTAIAELNSWCNGTVGTLNATAYVLYPGPVATANTGCTTTSGNGSPMTRAVTASNFFVTAGTAGAVAGSGVMKLLKNGSATAITCTLGTTLACNDTTHTASYAAGDVWLATVTTGQATDSTANVRVQFQIQ